MAVVRVFECKGWTSEQYDELIARMELAGHAAPGVLFHVAGPTDDGFRAIDVYDSLESADRLANEKVIPIVMALGLTPPEISQFDVHSTLVP